MIKVKRKDITLTLAQDTILILKEIKKTKGVNMSRIIDKLVTERFEQPEQKLIKDREEHIKEIDVINEKLDKIKQYKEETKGPNNDNKIP